MVIIVRRRKMGLIFLPGDIFIWILIYLFIMERFGTQFQQKLSLILQEFRYQLADDGYLEIHHHELVSGFNTWKIWLPWGALRPISLVEHKHIWNHQHVHQITSNTVLQIWLDWDCFGFSRQLCLAGRQISARKELLLPFWDLNSGYMTCTEYRWPSYGYEKTILPFQAPVELGTWW